MICPICKKRKAQRYCPAIGDKICAVCCGTEREVSMNCPLHCPYLIAAHRYEEESFKVREHAEIPFADVYVPPDLIHERETFAIGICATLARFAAKHPLLSDADILAVLSALAETARTAASGIYYEKRPDDSLRRDLYTGLANFLSELRKHETEHASQDVTKDSQVFHILVFLAQLGAQRTNGRPRSKAFLGFLQRQFPLEEAAIEQPRLIVP